MTDDKLFSTYIKLPQGTMKALDTMIARQPIRISRTAFIEYAVNTFVAEHFDDPRI